MIVFDCADSLIEPYVTDPLLLAQTTAVAREHLFVETDFGRFALRYAANQVDAVSATKISIVSALPLEKGSVSEEMNNILPIAHLQPVNANSLEARGILAKQYCQFVEFGVSPVSINNDLEIEIYNG